MHEFFNTQPTLGYMLNDSIPFDKKKPYFKNSKLFLPEEWAMLVNKGPKYAGQVFANPDIVRNLNAYSILRIARENQDTCSVIIKSEGFCKFQKSVKKEFRNLEKNFSAMELTQKCPS